MRRNLTLGIIVLLVVAAGSRVAGQAAAGDDSTRWTPALSMRYRSVSGTAISPDGSLIAYVVREPVMEGEKSEYLSHVWVVSADGETNVQYTRGEKSAGNPQFSPDGTYLTFTSSRSGKNQVWIMRVAGGEAEQLTEAENDVGSYRWSPDGTRIAYSMRDPETEEEKEAKREKRDVILVDQNFKYSHIYVVTVARNEEGERETKRITAGEFEVTQFDWSPDGTRIVFAHKPDPRVNTFDTDISLVPADSGPVTPLVVRPGADSDPLFSPDGLAIAFTSHGGTPQRVGLSDVYVVSVAGGEPRKLADTYDRNANIRAWSRDGKEIYYTEVYRTSRHVFALPVSGGAARRLTEGEGAFGSVSFDAGRERMAFTYQDLEQPVNVHVSQLERFRMQRLTDVHAAVPGPPMGRTVLISWKSKDGLPVEGLLTYPVDYREGRRYPLILNVHGGPAGNYGRTFTGAPGIYMLQYFAQNGYAILRPNPRGSTGYGKEFRYANVRDWGFGDFDDLMAGVDEVIEMGVAHPDSLLLMGWSYGGYMTSFAVTRTNRFKAASMGAGLPDLISMVTTTDIPDYLAAHMGAEFWEDYETYQRHSAIYRIADVTTPTQVIHGQRDLRVPFTQGQEFYVALSRRGVPTEMVVYPRTPHGPREPKFLMDVSQRIMAWFERHLGRSAGAAEGTSGR